MCLCHISVGHDTCLTRGHALYEECLCFIGTFYVRLDILQFSLYINEISMQWTYRCLVRLNLFTWENNQIKDIQAFGLKILNQGSNVLMAHWYHFSFFVNRDFSIFPPIRDWPIWSTQLNSGIPWSSCKNVCTRDCLRTLFLYLCLYIINNFITS